MQGAEGSKDSCGKGMRRRAGRRCAQACERSRFDLEQLVLRFAGNRTAVVSASLSSASPRVRLSLAARRGAAEAGTDPLHRVRLAERDKEGRDAHHGSQDVAGRNRLRAVVLNEKDDLLVAGQASKQQDKKK